MRMRDDLEADVERVGRIAAVPTILDVVCRTTGMRFAAVARVTDEHWIACSTLDDLDFGLEPGGELKLETTLCHEVRQSRQAVVINNVAEDEAYCGHATPRMYGFQSYISMPIVLADGSFFGTLCAIDPRPARLKTPETIGMFELFAELIASHLDADRELTTSRSDLLEERRVSELREQFIAVLGHDLRNPLSAIISGATLLRNTPLNDRAVKITGMIEDSGFRMSAMLDNVQDFARSRLGGGMVLNIDTEALEPVLNEVIAELSAALPDRIIARDF